MTIRSTRWALTVLMLLGIAGLTAIPKRASAATLDTPPVSDPGGTGIVLCDISNLHSTKTLSLDSSRWCRSSGGKTIERSFGG